MAISHVHLIINKYLMKITVSKTKGINEQNGLVFHFCKSLKYLVSEYKLDPSLSLHHDVSASSGRLCCTWCPGEDGFDLWTPGRVLGTLRGLRSCSESRWAGVFLWVWARSLSSPAESCSWPCVQELAAATEVSQPGRLDLQSRPYPNAACSLKMGLRVPCMGFSKKIVSVPLSLRIGCSFFFFF